MRRAILLTLVLLLGSCRTAAPGSSAPPRVRIEIDPAEARAVLRIAEEQASRGAVSDGSWAALVATHGYRDLKLREQALGRSFTDDEFRAFATSEELVQRRDALRGALTAWSGYDLDASAGRALRYLPPGARIEAIVYPMIKPKHNSFVYRTDRGRAIFLYLDPEVSGPKFENTVVHELHHIGYASACEDPPPANPRAWARAYTGGFGEGFAVLAAAGDASTHPHATSDPAERAVWERDVARVGEDMRRLEAFFLDIAAGRLATENEMDARALSFVATEDVPQGAYYTVGWHMASTIENARGRDAFVKVVCDAPAVMALYDEIAGGSGAPRWSQELLEALGERATALTGQAAQASPPPPAPQNPSPMVETTREHRRIEKSEPEGTRWTLRAGEREVPLFLPKHAAGADPIDLIVHFHGAAWLAETSAASLKASVAIVMVNAGAGSGKYASAFESPEAFESILASAAERLAPRKIGGIWLTGFSAGHGAIRSILGQPAGERVRGILLLDGLHTGYVPDRKVLAEGGALDTAKLEPFARFAREAAAGTRRMVITHSEIFPGTFASTTETADWVIAELGLRRRPLVAWGPMGMQQLSEVRKGDLVILGFAGNSAPDHIDQFHGMPEFLRMLIAE